MRLVQKAFVVPTLLLVVVVVLVLGFVFKDVRQYKKGLATPTPKPTETHKAMSSMKPGPWSKDITIPHELLPGFDITIPSSWNVTIKQFGEKDPRGFVSSYWLNPNNNAITEGSMGIRIEKENVSLELIFDIVADDNYFGCSDKVIFDDIGNGWFRITDSRGFFYTNKVYPNKTTIGGMIGGTLSDEWSAVENHTYKMCYQGIGVHFKDDTPKSIAPSWGGGMMLENPKIKGKPTRDQLMEIDAMIRSIKGIE